VSADNKPVKQQVSMRSMSARLARSLTGNRVKVDPVLDPLVSIHREIHPKADVALLQRAYNKAERLHEGVYRKSGDPYISHPLAVATIAAEIGMDTTTLVAALLHDTVEDTDYSIDDLEHDFGAEVARLVDGGATLDKQAPGAGAGGGAPRSVWRRGAPRRARPRRRSARARRWRRCWHLGSRSRRPSSASYR